MTEKEIREMKENLEKALSDKEFLKNIMNMEKVEDVQKAFAEREIKLTREEVQVLGAMINRACRKKGKPLSQEDLNEVVGGMSDDSNPSDESDLMGDPTSDYDFLKCIFIHSLGWTPVLSIRNRQLGFFDNAGFATSTAGALLGTAACTAAMIGAYKGVKWAYNKIKGKGKDN